MKYKNKVMAMFLIMLMALCTATPVQAATIKLNKTKEILFVGQSVKLKMIGTAKKAVWSTSNKKVATVKAGKVTAKQAGTAKITAKIGKKKYTCKISVLDDAEIEKWITSDENLENSTTVTLSEKSISIKQYDCGYVSVNVNKEDIDVVWTTDDKSVAVFEKIDPYGMGVIVWGESAGTTTLTATVGDVSEKIEVTVTEQEPPISYDEFTDSSGDNFIDWCKEDGKFNIRYLNPHIPMRGIQVGSSKEEVIQAYGDYSLPIMKQDGIVYMTLPYIDADTGVHFVKYFSIDDSGSVVNTGCIVYIPGEFGANSLFYLGSVYDY